MQCECGCVVFQQLPNIDLSTHDNVTIICIDCGKEYYLIYIGIVEKTEEEIESV